MISTMGEFFDELSKTKNGQGKIWLEDLVEECNPEQLAEFRATPFNHEEVLFLRDAICSMMYERLRGICTDELYERVGKNGHQFLEEMGVLSAKHGVDFGARGTDTNVTATEHCESAGVIKVVNGIVKPVEPREK